VPRGRSLEGHGKHFIDSGTARPNRLMNASRHGGATGFRN
jgi:hypothetical protein